MGGITGVVATIALALGVVAGAVFGLGDRTVLVSAPEAITEDFFRALATGRYDPARPYLAEALRDSVSAGSLRVYVQGIEARHGAIRDVRGERRSIAPDSAAASAILKTDRQTELSIAVTLRREHGQWAIARLAPLTVSSPPR